MEAVPAMPASSVETLETAEALGLECVLFEVPPDVEPSDKPPVRIFLGSEEAQHRAERVFLYSLAKLRDPARVYRVYLMKDLPGFDRRDWRTGFTQYRFAIPELAGGSGRAIYNDVDQIYLADPAELFDQDMGSHGYLAVVANDTSVMVLDCARMLPWWHLDAARRQSKRELIVAPATEPGLWGELAAGWNARDMEYRAGESRLLHYTALHLQPWRPTPEQYSYHPHPLGQLWLGLEWEADIANYQPFTRARPSAGYLAVLEESRVNPGLSTALPPAATDFLAGLGIGEAPLLCTLCAPAPGVQHCFSPALAASWPSERVPALVVSGLVEHLPAEDVHWFVEALFELAQRALYLHIDLRQVAAPADRPAPPRLTQPATWWRDRLATAVERHPAVAWQVDLVDVGGARHRFRYLPRAGSPQVWVLLGHHEGDNRQLLALAEALGWPYQTRRLAIHKQRIAPPWLLGASLWWLDRRRSEPLMAPWPDLVLASGRRAAPVARWICHRSGASTRLVHMGRPQSPLRAFDLVVTTPQYQLPARENVLHNLLPLSRPLLALTAEMISAWHQRLDSLPRPWVALLIGGNSATSMLDDRTARQLRAHAEALARRRGGSLLVATSPRTPAPAADILLADSPLPGLRYRWRPDDPDNPYPAFVELADEFIVTGDSASMIADACASGRPVRYAVLPRPPRRRRLRLRPAVWMLRHIERRRERLGRRGTPRQQGGLERWFDCLVAAGLLRPPRRLELLHVALRAGGIAWPLEDPEPTTPPPNNRLEQTVAAVRRLFFRGQAVRR